MTCERTTGFEPAISTLARWCSSQLSYVRMLKNLGVICLGMLALSAANPRFPTKKNSIGRLRVRPIGPGCDAVDLPVWTPAGSGLASLLVGVLPGTPAGNSKSWAIGAVVARFVHTEEVTGSNPVSPTS